MAQPSMEPPVFGSVHRESRGDPAYQASRFGMLWRFSFQLLQARESQLRHVWKEYYRLGGSWDEQRAYIGRLEAGQEDRQKIIQSQKDWIDQLEAERDRLWAEVQRLGKEWEAQTAALQERSRCIDGLQARLAGLEGELRQAQTALSAEREQLAERESRLKRIEANQRSLEARPLFRLLRRIGVFKPA